MNTNLITEIENFIRRFDSENFSPFAEEDTQYDGLDFVISGLDFVNNSAAITSIEQTDVEDNIVIFSIDVQYTANILAEADDYREASHDNEDDEWYNVKPVSIQGDFNVTLEDIEVELDTETEQFRIMTPVREIRVDINVNNIA